MRLCFMALRSRRGRALTEVVFLTSRDPQFVPSVLPRHELVIIGLS